MPGGRFAAGVAAICALVLCGSGSAVRSAAGATFKPGSLVLSTAQANKLCGYSVNSPNDVAGGDSTLLPDGRIAIECSDDSIVVYDLAGQYVAWSMSISPYMYYAVGSDHLMLISSHTVPATGLQGATTTYTLTAVDLSNGATDWSVPFSASDEDDIDPSDGPSVGYEGPSGNPAHPDEIVMDYSTSMTSFNATTGATLWHFSAGGYLSSPAYWQQTGPYLGYGVNLAVQDTNAVNPSTFVEVAVSAASGATAWQQPVPAVAAESDDPTPDAIMPDGQGNAWLFWDRGYDERNIATGAELTSGAFPAGWDFGNAYGSISINPPDVLYTDGSQLQLYDLHSMSAPIWSVPADNVSINAVGSKDALISADAGEQIISLSNGAIVAPASQDPDNDDGVGFGGWGTPVDGYLPFTGYQGVSVFELETPSVTIPKSSPPAAPKSSPPAAPKSPALRWLSAARHGDRTFVITGHLASAAEGSVTLHLRRVRRSIIRACAVSSGFARCSVRLPVSGVWSAALAYSSKTNAYRSMVTGTHVLHAR